MTDVSDKVEKRKPGRPPLANGPGPMVTATLEPEVGLALHNEAVRQDRSVSSLIRQYVKQGLVRDGLLDEEVLEKLDRRPLTMEEYIASKSSD